MQKSDTARFRQRLSAAQLPSLLPRTNEYCGCPCHRILQMPTKYVIQTHIINRCSGHKGYVANSPAFDYPNQCTASNDNCYHVIYHLSACKHVCMHALRVGLHSIIVKLNIYQSSVRVYGVRSTPNSKFSQSGRGEHCANKWHKFGY